MTTTEVTPTTVTQSMDEDEDIRAIVEEIESAKGNHFWFVQQLYFFTLFFTEGSNLWKELHLFWEFRGMARSKLVKT